MIELLAQLNFKYVPQEETDAWVKTYRGFKLWIALHSSGLYVSSITTTKLEISLPELEEAHMMQWIKIFNKQNIL